MGILSKSFALLAVLAMAFSIFLVVETASCESNVLPPNFTVWPNSDSVTVTITNQGINGSYTVYYDVRYKSNLNSNWFELYPTQRWMSDTAGTYSDYIDEWNCLVASPGNYTIINIPTSPGTQLDVQVQTITARDASFYEENSYWLPGEPVFYENQGIICVARSDWSSTLTTSIPTPSPAPAPPTPTPTPISVLGLNLEQFAIVLLAVAVACLAVGMVLLWSKVIRRTNRV
jgi:hypothetical protein